MTPLLEALQAASKVGFDAPVCDKCEGRGRYYCCPEHPCDWCDATGLDASDPEKLIGRAIAELHCKRRMSLHRIGVDIDSDLIKQPPTDDDGDQEGQFATALLRLVARVGGAK